MIMRMIDGGNGDRDFVETDTPPASSLHADLQTNWRFVRREAPGRQMRIETGHQNIAAPHMQSARRNAQQRQHAEAFNQTLYFG